MKLKFSMFTLAIIYNFISLAQGEDYPDEEDIKDFERYAHLGLSKFEIISIIVGLILLLIAKNMSYDNSNLRTALFVIGGLASIPLLLVILAVGQKLLGYALILGLIGGGLYYLFGFHKK